MSIDNIVKHLGPDAHSLLDYKSIGLKLTEEQRRDQNARHDS